jgi:hypothetical protein
MVVEKNNGNRSLKMYCKKVKQSRYRPQQAQRVDRGIVIPFPDLGTRKGCVVSITARPRYPQERPCTRCTGDWVGPSPVWTCAKNLAPTGISFPDRPARSHALYRLSYPGPRRFGVPAEILIPSQM